MIMPSKRASVAERARLFAAGAPVVGVHFLGDVPVFVLGEEALLFVPADGEPERIVIHAGGILTAASDGKEILTGGDDGTVVITHADRSHDVISADFSLQRWVDHVAFGPGSIVAWSVGKRVVVNSGGDLRVIEVPSTAGGLAFAPKGVRLAIAHYNGVSLWFPKTEAKPERLEWKGSHIAASFSPDGRFLVTAMQEPTLHGWRLADGKHMRMSGYAAKVRSISWSASGKALATSGSRELIVWPFQGKDGPMGSEPAMLAPLNCLVTAVACHPRTDIVAVGYEDGTVLLVRTPDGAEILARRPDGNMVSALAWNAAGTRLAFATETGDAGVAELGAG
jgi:WD40 repeat protein